MNSTVSEGTTLDEQICFALYNASRALTARYRDLLAPFDLTYPQYLVLLVLWEEGPTTVARLGERLQLDSGTLSPLLGRLDRAELIARSRRPEDERSVLVTLTDAGADLRGQAAGIPGLICAATGLDLPDLRVLQQQISALAQHVRALD